MYLSAEDSLAVRASRLPALRGADVFLRVVHIEVGVAKERVPRVGGLRDVPIGVRALAGRNGEQDLAPACGHAAQFAKCKARAFGIALGIDAVARVVSADVLERRD